LFEKLIVGDLSPSAPPFPRRRCFFASASRREKKQLQRGFYKAPKNSRDFNKLSLRCLGTKQKCRSEPHKIPIANRFSSFRTICHHIFNKENVSKALALGRYKRKIWERKNPNV